MLLPGLEQIYSNTNKWKSHLIHWNSQNIHIDSLQIEVPDADFSTKIFIVDINVYSVVLLKNNEDRKTMILSYNLKWEQ